MINNQPVDQKNNSPVFIQLNFSEFNRFYDKYEININEFIFLELVRFRYIKYNSFNFSNDYLCNLLKINVSTLTRIKKNLIEKNLIIVNTSRISTGKNKIVSSSNVILTAEYYNFSNAQIKQTKKAGSDYKKQIKSNKKDSFSCAQKEQYIINDIINDNLIDKTAEKVDKEKQELIKNNIRKMLAEKKKTFDY